MRLRNVPVPFLVLALCMSILTTGCSTRTSLLTWETLSRRVQELLGEHGAVAVQAGRLTDFSWQTLCFRRDDVLHLVFLVDGTRHRVALPYEEFFVDEGYVANSLEDICVTPTQTLVVRRKDPGHQGLCSSRRYLPTARGERWRSSGGISKATPSRLQGKQLQCVPRGTGGSSMKNGTPQDSKTCERNQP